MAVKKSKVTCGSMFLASMAVILGAAISVASLNPAPVVLVLVFVVVYFAKKK